MPFDPNADWTAATNAGARDPVYFIVFDGLATVHYSTGPVRSPSVTTKPYLKVPDSIGQKVAQLTGKQSISLSTLEIIDRDGELTSLLSTRRPSPALATLINRTVALFAGYSTLAEAKYAQIGRGQIATVTLDKDGVTYMIGLRDLKRYQLDDIMTNADAQGSLVETTLSADVAIGAKSLSLGSVFQISSGGKGTQSSNGDFLWLGPSTDGANQGAEEKIQVVGVVAAPPSVVMKFGTVYKYKKGDVARWATTIIEGNPVNILYSILTGDFDNATFPLIKALGKPTGLAVAAADVDSAGMVKERDRIMQSAIWRFEFRTKTTGFTFLEDQLYRMVGFPVLTGDGRLGLRLYRPAWPDDAAAGLPVLDEADILSWRWETGLGLHVNRAAIGVDIDAETGRAAQTIVTEDTADQTATKETSRIEIDRTGLRETLRGVRIAEALGGGLLRHFLDPPPQLRVVTGLRRRALQAGEDLSFSHSRIPNPKTGTRGMSAVRLAIVERTENFNSGTVELLLQDFNFTRPSFIGPAGTIPDYDSASVAQREYMYIGPPGTPIGNFSDGTPPYEVN